MEEYKKIEELINNSECVEAYERLKILPNEVIEKLENTLGMKFPSSFIWYLNKYSYLSIYGNEVFSIYEIDNNAEALGDILYQYNLYIEEEGSRLNHIPIFDDEFAQLYIMEYCSEQLEYKVYVKYSETGEEKKIYANDFLSFLKKQISTEYH